MSRGTQITRTLGVRAAFHLVRALVGLREQSRPQDCFRLYSVCLPDNGIADLDIVFVHGLGGDARDTWQDDEATDFFWPEHLQTLLPDCKVRVLSYGYPADKTVIGNQFRIREHGEFLVNHLLAGGVGERRTVLICHSLGGLVTKAALVHVDGKSEESTNTRYEKMLKSVVGIVFLGVPHTGSRIASLVTTAQKLVGIQLSSDVVALLSRDYGDKELSDLDNQFRQKIWLS